MGCKIIAVITCDKCGAREIFNNARMSGETTFANPMRKKGWSVGAKWLCPRCRKRPRGKKS